MNELKYIYRKNPSGMLRHMKKIDLFKTLKTKFKLNPLFKSFPINLPLGADAPDFELETTEGKRVSVSNFLGKKCVVLEFGSIT